MGRTITVRGEGITVDLLLWREYGVKGKRALKATLDLNPGVAGLGPVLPLGTAVTLADLPVEQRAVNQSTAIDLFGGD